MYRVDKVLDLKPFDHLVSFAQGYPQHVQRIAQTEFDQPPTLFSLITFEPPNRAVHPFVWSPNPVKNARGRRKYFALIRAGEIRVDSYGYIRTHKLRDGYSVRMFINGLETFIEVRNKENRAYRWTKGKQQIIGHAVTGWKPDAPVIVEWLNGYRVRLLEGLTLGAQVMGKRKR